MTNTAQLLFPDLSETSKYEVRWFTSIGCVEYRDDERYVFVGGKLIGRFSATDSYRRSLILLGLDEDPSIRKGKLARAFGITDEYLRRIRKRVADQGLEAMPKKGRGGSKPKLDAPAQARVRALFSQGVTIKEAWQAEGQRKGVSYQAFWRMHKDWAASGVAARDEETAQQTLTLVVDGEDIGSRRELSGAAVPQSPAGDFDDEGGAVEAPLRGGRFVQHVGGWLLLALVHSYGLTEAAMETWEAGCRWKARLRLALEATILALGIGQRCVEGVRRLETPSGGLLLRADAVPSESWVRRVLKRYVDEAGGARLHLRMTGHYLAQARREDGAAVFYVDNHMRPYTGKHTVRKGWRMQDKRVKPGATDYYVHDEDGRPVFRVDVPSNGALTQWLGPITQFLRAGLGKGQRILVAFDRAGAYPEQLAALRNTEVEFVTYERRPYELLADSAFDETVEVDGETIGVHEDRAANLGKGRGRVRRIALKMSDGHQVNLLASSGEPAWRLIEVMLGRWVQENGFKHGVERWGINQLDRRKVQHYPPETIIPNPARRRLNHTLLLARHREGEARRKLALLPEGDRRSERLAREIAAAHHDQLHLEALRPVTPEKAPLAETELAGKLVYHRGHYKTVLDTIRIACANAESELACELAPRLNKPAEAKKALANLFAAPGDVRVNKKSITVEIYPAGRKDEREAFVALFETVNRWNLTLPGDPESRPLRFKTQLS